MISHVGSAGRSPFVARCEVMWPRKAPAGRLSLIRRALLALMDQAPGALSTAAPRKPRSPLLGGHSLYEHLDRVSGGRYTSPGTRVKDHTVPDENLV
ncbi:hypothetical protein MRX96_018540 [Rhipicephalus microplus]